MGEALLEGKGMAVMSFPVLSQVHEDDSNEIRPSTPQL